MADKSDEAHEADATDETDKISLSCMRSICTSATTCLGQKIPHPITLILLIKPNSSSPIAVTELQLQKIAEGRARTDADHLHGARQDYA